MNVISFPELKKAGKFKVGIDKEFRISLQNKLGTLGEHEILILIIGIQPSGFMMPEGKFYFEGVEHEILGWYTEIEIAVDKRDKNISFSLFMPSGQVKLHWWIERKQQKKNTPRIEILPRLDNDFNAALHCLTTMFCNFRCEYCFLIADKFFRNSCPDIQTEKFVKTLDDTGRIFNLILSGGEPFVISNIIEACSALTKNHYISLATNLSVSKRIAAFSNCIDPERVKYILASFHVQAMEKSNLVDHFIKNFHLLEEKGFLIQPQIVAYPPILKDVEKYIKIFTENGLEVIFAPFIGKYNNKTYPDAYTAEERKALKWTGKVSQACYYHKGKICIAGYNSAVVLASGDVLCCMHVKRYLGHIYEKITFRDKMTKCPYEFCTIPLSIENYSLYQTALKSGVGYYAGKDNEDDYP